VRLIHYAITKFLRSNLKTDPTISLIIGASGNVVATRFWLRYTASRYNFHQTTIYVSG